MITPENARFKYAGSIVIFCVVNEEMRQLLVYFELYVKVYLGIGHWAFIIITFLTHNVIC